MVRILCIGDAHIPIRAQDLPNQIYTKINQLTEIKLFDYTFFTGDLVKFKDLIDFLNQKTRKTLFRVIGNMDYHYGDRDSSINQKLDVLFEDNKKVVLGLTHGSNIKPRGDHLQLEQIAIENKYNILVSGHTHKEEIFLTNKGILLLNPGSCTGAWSFVASGIPSFIELKIDVKTKNIAVNLYQMDKQTRSISIAKYFFSFESYKIHKMN